MPTPTFEEVKIPLLNMFGDDQSHKLGDLVRPLAEHFKLTEAEVSERLPSGTETKWHNRVSWALYDLYRAGLLERIRHGTYKISPVGIEVKAAKPRSLDRQTLMQYPAFAQWMTASDNKDRLLGRDRQTSLQQTEASDRTPEERISEAHAVLQSNLVDEVLNLLQKIDPLKFEKLVIDVLLAMGYGGSREEAASLTKASHDEGIDGIINEDRLGLDVIYVQAKRWNEKYGVGRKEIQSFVGALAGKQANKGIFITTSSFADTATAYVHQIPQKVVLIDGTRLAELMIEHGIGVSVERSYDIKHIDSDYFDS